MNFIDIKITCADQLLLAATSFTPKQAMKGAILIAPATGIKRQFYANFATHLAKHGYGVVTFDNRGIGESLVGTVNHCNASLQCWGEQDLPAALKQLQQSFPDTRYHLVGHSAGGQLVGLMPNANEFSSIFNYGCSSGSLRNMHLSHQLKAHFFMNFFIPMSNALFGHTKSQWVDMGEPLPKNVAKQWQAWCNGSSYVKMAFGKTIHTHYYDELETPSMWVNATDDNIANIKNRDDMLSVFKKLPANKLTISAKDHGLDEIGHMKFFSRKSEVLWAYALNWLAAH
jgi:predicted alpha/beta hydrolase